MPTNFPVPTLSRFKVFLNPASVPQAQNTAAFRACHQRFEECLEFAGSHAASPLIEAAATFVLDFEITAKRALGAESSRYKLFRLFYLKSLSRKECCTKLKLTAWAFSSATQSIEREMGAAFTQAGMFPLSPYFANSDRKREKIAA